MSFAEGLDQALNEAFEFVVWGFIQLGQNATGAKAVCHYFDFVHFRFSNAIGIIKGRKKGDEPCGGVPSGEGRLVRTFSAKCTMGPGVESR